MNNQSSVTEPDDLVFVFDLSAEDRREMIQLYDDYHMYNTLLRVSPYPYFMLAEDFPPIIERLMNAVKNAVNPIFDRYKVSFPVSQVEYRELSDMDFEAFLRAFRLILKKSKPLNDRHLGRISEQIRNEE